MEKNAESSGLTSIYNLAQKSGHKLSSRLEKAFLNLAFENQYNLHPRQIKDIAAKEADAFINFLNNVNTSPVADHAREQVRAGLGDRAVIVLWDVLRAFCRDVLADETHEMQSEGLEAASKYIGSYFEGYLKEREASILKKQEELRRALSAALDSQRQELHIKEHAINTSINGIMLTDLNGVVSYVNSAFLNMWGYSDPREVLGHNSIDFWSSNEVRKIIEELPGRRGEGWRGEFTARRKDESTFEVEISASLIKDDAGIPSGIMVFFVDITDRKQAEQELRRLEEHLFQSQKIEAVGTLASGIAHDFNNILQAISGYIQLIVAKGDVDQTSQRYLSEMDHAVERAGDLVHRLLTFSRRVKPTLKPVDLNAEIVRTVKMLERTIPKMISIDMHLAGDLAVIKGDANQLEQMLMNLGANARDAMPGGGKLIIETRNVNWNEDDCEDGSSLAPGRYAQLTVTDTGSGMDAETINHIFEPFFTTKGVGKGTGLGLSTVHGIIKSHGGYIDCQSQPGQGASFEIFLPESKADESILGDAIKCGVDVRGGDETILVVDDEKALLEISEDILREYGYNVITADSGEKLLDIYRRTGPNINLVILDLGMPGMGGRDSLRELLKIDPWAKVLIASGYSAEDQVKECITSGACGFIAKPYRLNDMLIKIRQTLDFQLKISA